MRASVVALRKAKLAVALVARPSGATSGKAAGTFLRQDETLCGRLDSMSIVNENDQANRAISTGKLHALPHFHTRPINVVVFHGSDREYSFSGGFPA